MRSALVYLISVRRRLCVLLVQLFRAMRRPLGVGRATGTVPTSSFLYMYRGLRGTADPLYTEGQLPDVQDNVG